MTHVAGAIVLAWCAVAAYKALADARRLPPDLMPRLDQEFHVFAPAIPTDVTVVGYLEQYHDPGSDAAVQMWYAAQYALVPHVVDPHSRPDFMIVARGTARPGGDPRLGDYFQLLEIPGGHRLFRRRE